MFKYLLASLLLYISSLFASAQENQVSVQFVSFPISSKSNPIELLVGDGESIQVELPTNCLSPVYKVPAMNQWQLGKMTVGDEGEKIFIPYGKVKSKGSSKQLILVIRKGATYKDGFKLIPIKYNVADFGGGQYFMMNATKVKIGIELGVTREVLQPNNYKLLTPKASKVVNGHEQLFTKVYFDKDNKMKPFYSSTWRLNNKARCLVFFYHEPHKQRIRTHTIRTYIRRSDP